MPDINPSPLTMKKLLPILAIFALLVVSAKAQQSNGPIVFTNVVPMTAVPTQPPSAVDSLIAKVTMLTGAIVALAAALGRFSVALSNGAKALPALVSVFQGSANVPPSPVSTPDIAQVPIADLHAELQKRVADVAPPAPTTPTQTAK